MCGWLTCSQGYGGHGGGETPGLIPNPEAKPSSADGTALGRVWESRTPPDLTSKKAHTITGVGLLPFLLMDDFRGLVLTQDKPFCGWFARPASVAGLGRGADLDEQLRGVVDRPA